MISEFLLWQGCYVMRCRVAVLCAVLCAVLRAVCHAMSSSGCTVLCCACALLLLCLCSWVLLLQHLQRLILSSLLSLQPVIRSIADGRGQLQIQLFQ
jgi:hypothetical protein